MFEFDSAQLQIFLFGDACAPSAGGKQSPERSDFELLYFLAAPRNEPLTRAELIESLWSDRTTKPESPRATLRVRLSHLRKAFPRVAASLPDEEETLTLDPAVLNSIDIYAFHRLLNEADAAVGTDAEGPLLNSALSLYKGPLLPNSKVKCIVKARARYVEIADCIQSRLSEINPTASPAELCSNLVTGEDGNESNVNAPKKPGGSAQHEKPTGATVSDVASNNETDAHPPKRLSPKVAMRIIAAVAVFALLALLLIQNIYPQPEHGALSVTPADTVRKIHRIALQLSTNPNKQDNDLLARRAALCIALAEEAADSWNLAGEKQWFETIRQIEPDIESSIDWLASHEPEKAIQLVGALSRYWSVYDQMSKVRRWMRPLMDKLPPAESPIRARALTLYAMGLMNAAESPGAEARKEGVRALSVIRQAHDMYVTLNDQWGQANTVRCTGHIFLALNHQEEAEACFLDARNQFSRLQPSSKRTVGLALTSWALGLIRRPDGPDGPNRFYQLRLFLTSTALWQRLGTEAWFEKLMQELANCVGAAYDLPNCKMTPARIAEIKQYITFSSDYVALAILHSDRGELNLTHRAVLKASCLVNDRKLFLEQIAFYIGDWSDLSPSRMALLASYYCNHIDELSLVK